MFRQIVKKIKNRFVPDEDPRDRMDLKYNKAKVPVRIVSMSVQIGTYYNGVNIWFTIGDHPKEYFVETTNSEANLFNFSGYNNGDIIKVRDVERIGIIGAVRRIVINNILHEYKKDMVEIIIGVDEYVDTDRKVVFDYNYE